MDRQLKFRAFDSHLKIMANEIHHLDSLNEYISRDNQIVMQFVGLLDKNRKEIYQDDILRVCKSYYGEYLVRVVWDELQCCFATDNYSAKQVKNPKRWDLKHDCVRSYGFCMNSYSQLIGGYNNTSHSYKDGDQTITGYDFEVVGNYHENKDLLK